MNYRKQMTILDRISVALLVLAWAGCSDSSDGTSAAGNGGATFGGNASSVGGNAPSAGDTVAAGGTAGGPGNSGPGNRGGATGGVGVGGSGNAATTLTADCANLANAPLSVSEVSGARAYHDVVFAESGNLVGNTSNDLMMHSGSGAAQPFVPGIGIVEGMDVLDNGDIVAIAADANTFAKKLVRVTSSGGQSDISSDVGYAFGVLAGPDGMIYVGSDSGLLKFDPASNQRSVVYDTSSNTEWQIHFMDYSPDRKRLYLCTNTTAVLDPNGNTKGAIRYFDLDDSFKPTTAEPKLLAEYAGSDGTGGYCDGIVVDACGNLYVADYFAQALIRITPTGSVSMYKEWSADGTTYGHGMGWGIASGSWDPNALYLPQPYNSDSVVKVVVGVPGRPR